MVVNTAEHVLLLPVGLNHLIESHNPTKKSQIKKAKYNELRMGSGNISVCIE